MLVLLFVDHLIFEYTTFRGSAFGFDSRYPKVAPGRFNSLADEG